MKLYCLHGFLGLPSDWDFLKREHEAVDVFREFLCATPLPECVSGFNTRVSGRAEDRVLLGYSMGGRLALHAVVRNPSLWKAAIIVSAHPGLADLQRAEKEARISQDENWAKKFETQKWSSLVQEWESLPAFCGKALPITRREADFRRADLAGALRNWSLGRQEDLSTRLPEIPILWIAGSEDTRYVSIYQEKWPQATRIVPGAGHRVPWEKPRELEEILDRFFGREFAC